MRICNYAPISLKQRNQALSSLQTNLSRVVDCLERLDSRRTDFKFWSRQKKVLEEIRLLRVEISRLLTSEFVTATRKASNRYSELVSGTVAILNEYNPGLMRKRGQDLARFFEMVLESIGHDKKSTRLLIEDNWETVIEPIIRGYGDHEHEEEGYDSIDEEMVNEDAEDRDP